MSASAHFVSRLLGLCIFALLFTALGRPVSAAPATAWSTQAIAEDGSCSLQGESSMVVCGRELFAGVLDDHLLTMRSDVCDELLEGLFDRQTCAMDDAGCHAMSAGTLGPRAPRISNSDGPSSAADLARLLAWSSTHARAPRVPNAALPESFQRTPEPPPPRSLVG